VAGNHAAFAGISKALRVERTVDANRARDLPDVARLFERQDVLLLRGKEKAWNAAWQQNLPVNVRVL
jgi:hypothetical protein